MKIETDYARITIEAKAEHEDSEFLVRHALHQIIKEYKKEHGFWPTIGLMRELNAYHTAKVIE